jgi:hypothetical protein
MAATATAPRTTRRGTARRTRPTSHRAQPRRGITPAAGFAIPAAAVGRTAVAVGNFADSGLVVRLTRSRLWIGLVAGLLVGIVGLNVYALSLSASGSKVAQRAESLARENSALRAQLTERLSNERVQGVADKLGLAAPQPDSIRYLRSADADAKTAAKRLLDGELSPSVAASPVATEPVMPEEAPVAPVPVEPAPVAPADPAATATPTAPAPTTP